MTAPLNRGKQDFERNISGKVKVGRLRKMSDKIPLPFQNNKNIVSQAPNTKSRTENKSVFSSNMIREKNTLSLAISMNIFPTGLHYLQRKKKTI